MEEDRADSDGASPTMPRSNPKLIGGGEKRKSQQKDGLPKKRVKMRHLDSVIQSEEMNAIDSGSVTEKLHMDGDGSSSSKTSDGGSSGTLSLSPKSDQDPDGKCVSSRGYEVDLNAEDVLSSINHYNSIRPNANIMDLKQSDVSECGSCAVSPKEKDSLRAWKEMKQNGFLSSSHQAIFGGKNSAVVSSSITHGGIPVVPRKRGRKSKTDGFNQKMEIAKKEKVDRFSKIAAPSGLLNGLNPGIINHVRNRKQVHSIIEALVKSDERLNSQSKQAKKDHQIMDGLQLHHSDERWPPNTHSWDKQSRGCTIPGLKSCSSNPAGRRGHGDSSVIDQVSEADTLALKFSSSAQASEIFNASSLSKEDSSSLTSVSSLSVQGASAASLWLELLQQDIKGRLSALRRSKKRVRAVTATELSFLISKEFSEMNAIAEMHMARWTALFDHMDKQLTEEEKQLENWSYQVRDMQLCCDQGLNHINGSMVYGLQHLEASVIRSKLGNKEGSVKEMAVKAAAASIYSTCNLLSSSSVNKENVSCF